MKCPACEGEGEFKEYCCHKVCDKTQCGYCKGKGGVSIFRWIEFKFWSHMPEWMWDLWYWLFGDKSEEE